MTFLTRKCVMWPKGLIINVALLNKFLEFSFHRANLVYGLSSFSWACQERVRPLKFLISICSRGSSTIRWGCHFNCTLLRQLHPYNVACSLIFLQVKLLYKKPIVGRKIDLWYNYFFPNIVHVTICFLNGKRSKLWFALLFCESWHNMQASWNQIKSVANRSQSSCY